MVPAVRLENQHQLILVFGNNFTQQLSKDFCLNFIRFLQERL